MTASKLPDKQSPRKIREQELGKRMPATSAMTVPLATRDLKGVLGQFALESAFDTVTSRVREYGQQVVVRQDEHRPRWQPATLEKALATVKSYFFGGDEPRLFGGGVLERVRTEFALECVKCNLTNTPGQEADWYNAYHELAVAQGDSLVA